MSPTLTESAPYGAPEALNEARALSQASGQAPGPGEVFVDDQVERTTFHDFSLYEYMLDPWGQRDDRDVDTDTPSSPPPAAETPPPPEYLPADLDDLEGLSTYARLVISTFLDDEVRQAMADGASFDPRPIIHLLARFQLRCWGELAAYYQPSQVVHRQEDMLVYFVEQFLADLLELFEPMTEEKRLEFYARFFDPAVRAWAKRAAAMEMPWLVPGNNTQSDWTTAGYVVGETFGRVPKRLSQGWRNGQYTWMVDGWVTDQGRDVLCHEWAWGHIRLDQAHGIYAASSAKSGFGGEMWFAPFVNLGPNSASEVLIGAKEILDRRDPASDLDRLNQALRDLFAEFSAVLGTGPGPAATPASRYGFEPFPEGSINLGIRVVYRQAWKPRGVQPGELVRTIPLGPGQSEQVSFKVQVRNKLSRELQDVSSTETTDETTTKSTSSSEIVEEAASAHKWHLDTQAQGSFSIGAFGLSASTSAGYAGETSKSSRDTKSSLNESMQKAARVSRRETRVQVSTEREETFEQVRTSNIRNENQEIAVTYLYETIQRIYRVETAVESVEPVVYVAEHVPGPDELNLQWVRRYDWILGRVLLDESFRTTLEQITSMEPDFLETLTAEALGLDEVQVLTAVINEAKSSLAALNNLPGDVANTYEATLQAYQAAVERSRSLLREKRQQLTRIKRFVDHVADNILHYCRAIWSREDPERRTMRYRSLRMPARFVEVIDTQSVEVDPETGATVYAGHWEPDPNAWIQLSKAIHPAGPIGFAGNYAIFRLRRIRETDGISRVIRIALQSYFQWLPPTIYVEPPERGEALQAEVAIEGEDFYGGYSYLLRVGRDPAGQARYQLIRRNLDGPGQDITAAAAAASGLQPGLPADPLVLRFDGLLLGIRGGLQHGDELRMAARPPDLVDPEIKYRLALEPYRSRDQVEQDIRTENTSDIVVDTTNLWLSLLPGDGSILEPFKRAHREIDVELTRAELARRFLRLHEGRLADPDVEKVVVVTGDGRGVADAVAGAEAAFSSSGRATGSPAPPASGGDGLPPPRNSASSGDSGGSG